MSIQQQFQMNRKEVLASAVALEGRLQKKSTSVFVGFQVREWKVLEGGTKLAYRTPNEDAFRPEKTWRVAELHTEEVEDERSFLLHTPKRVYELRAETADERKLWMRAIEVLKREQRRKTKPAKGRMTVLPGLNRSPDSTLPSIDPFHQLNVTGSLLNQTGSALNQTLPPRVNSVSASKLAVSSFYASKSFPEDELKQKFGDMLKKLPGAYANFHVLVVRLTTKSKELFTNSSTNSHYILFSSKSLSPEEWISEENLTSAHLPHWADTDCLYRIQGTEGRFVVKMDSVTLIAEAESSGSLTVVTPKERLEFYCESLAARKRIKQALQMARINAVQNVSSGDSRRNYDNLILLHGYNLEEFNAKVSSMLSPLIPQEHSYEPEVIKKLIDNLSPFIVEVVGSLQRKVTVPTNAIVDFLRILHEEVRKHLKLVWDSSASSGKAKGGDILNILKSLSRYECIVNRYVKDSQLQDALKELSKMYMRVCFRNFETIILGIVMQERKDNFYRIEESEAGTGGTGGMAVGEGHLATHGVTDLFKFIYDVFEFAIPCWNNRLHLHNINRLVRRALSVFVRELRATVDEEDISAKELIAISNNYVQFSEEVEEFYDSKLAELKEQTKEAYDQLRNEYREVAMIVVDKLVLPLKIQLKIYFEKQTLYSASLEDAYRKIAESGVREHTKNAHFIFRKRYFQRVFATVREEICRMMEKQAKKLGKKKPQIGKLLQRVELYKKDCIEMATILAGSKLKLQREFDELCVLLTTAKRQEIRTILTESPQFYKRVYKSILAFRADYFEGSPLQQYVATLQSEPELRTPQSQDRRRSSFSKYYIQEMERNSVTSSLEKTEKTERERSESGEEKLRMISEGFVRRARQTSGTYEQIYLKLKKSVLYIYENERMQRCQNTIQIQSIQTVSVPNADKPVFTIAFSALHRSKEMRIKCQTVEESNRWVYTLQLELRRISNDRRMKKGVKIREKKSKLVIDYEELNAGNDYFSYNG